MRLDAELLAKTPSHLNPLKDRELDLRGHKIPAIENLGVTRDTLDTLDLSDNSITTLSNFPLLRRLQSLHLSNNPIRLISPSIPTSLPNLRSLILVNSALTKDSLGSVGVTLGRCRKLESLVLKGGEIEGNEWYRDWLVWCCKSLKSLDWDRIKEKDRQRAKTLFLTSTSTPTALATQLSTSVSAVTSKSFEPGVAISELSSSATAGKGAGRLLSKEEKERVRTAIEGAESVDEIRRLQRMLAQGFVPTEKDLNELLGRKKLVTKAGTDDAMDQD